MACVGSRFPNLRSFVEFAEHLLHAQSLEFGQYCDRGASMNAGIAHADRHAKPHHVWRTVLNLAALVPGSRWILLYLVALGFAAALAETIQVGLAVLFLFAILGDDTALAATGGPVASLLNLFGTGLTARTSWLAGLLVVLILFNAALIYLHDAMSAMMSGKVAQRMRDLVHKQYLTVGYQWLQQQDQGSLINTLADESWIVADAFASVARTAANLCAVIVFGAGLLCCHGRLR